MSNKTIKTYRNFRARTVENTLLTELNIYVIDYKYKKRKNFK